MSVSGYSLRKATFQWGIRTRLFYCSFETFVFANVLLGSVLCDVLVPNVLIYVPFGTVCDANVLLVSALC